MDLNEYRHYLTLSREEQREIERAELQKMKEEREALEATWPRHRVVVFAADPTEYETWRPVSQWEGRAEDAKAAMLAAHGDVCTYDCSYCHEGDEED